MNIDEMKKSKYLKRADVGQGKLLTIREIKKENVALESKPRDDQFVLYFNEEEKGMVLKWTNIQLIAKALGTKETSEWVGKQIVLYDDPNVTFGTEIVGGIRCRPPKAAHSATTTGTQPPAAAKSPSPFDDEIPF